MERTSHIVQEPLASSRRRTARLKTQSPLSTNRWKPSDSTLRTLSTEMGIDYPESSDSGDEVLSLGLGSSFSGP